MSFIYRHTCFYYRERLPHSRQETESVAEPWRYLANSYTCIGTDFAALASPWTNWRTLSVVSRLNERSPLLVLRSNVRLLGVTMQKN